MPGVNICFFTNVKLLLKTVNYRIKLRIQKIGSLSLSSPPFFFLTIWLFCWFFKKKILNHEKFQMHYVCIHFLIFQIMATFVNINFEKVTFSLDQSNAFCIIPMFLILWLYRKENKITQGDNFKLSCWIKSSLI